MNIDTEMDNSENLGYYAKLAGYSDHFNFDSKETHTGLVSHV